MYRVLRYFEDLQDGRHPYAEGDEFPRKGLDVSDERIIELKSPSNRQGVPLIEFVPDAPRGATKAEIYAMLEGQG